MCYRWQQLDVYNAGKWTDPLLKHPELALQFMQCVISPFPWSPLPYLLAPEANALLGMAHINLFLLFLL
jgi:hypothetical protein